jgi:hypothetical protein
MGLVIEGNGLGSNGIDLFSAKTVSIRDCLISRFTNDGVISNPGASINVKMSNSVISENGGDGIAIAPSGSPAVAVMLSGMHVENNGARDLFFSGASSLGGSLRATLAGSTVSGGGSPILVSSSGGNAAVSVSIFGSQITNGLIAVTATGANATVFLSQTTLSGNGAPCSISSNAVISSYGDNYLADNLLPDACTAGAVTTIARK